MKDFMRRTKERAQCAVLRGKMELIEFYKGEKGASDMVAVVVLIVIVIAVAVIFRERLLAVAQSVFDKLDGFVNG